MYWAPEVSATSGLGRNRRGRAVDIFALGCIFLEIAPLLSGHHISGFSDFRQTDGSKAFAMCPGKLIQWIRYLLSFCECLDSGPPLTEGRELCKLAFLMLDTNPKMRITARQLMALLDSDRADIFLGKKSCHVCRRGSLWNQTGLNLPLHSIFKDIENIELAKHPWDELNLKIMPDWQTTKREWLQEHMWW